MNDVRPMTNSRKLLSDGDPFQGREAVDRDAMGSEVIDLLLDPDQMILQGRRLRVFADDAEQALGLHLLEVDPPAGRVAEELLPALLEGEQEATVPGVDARGQVFGRDQGLARAGRPGDQDHRIAEEAAAAHPVQLGVPGRDPRHRGFLLELHGRERDHDDPSSGTIVNGHSPFW